MVMNAIPRQATSKPIVILLTLFVWPGCSGDDPLNRQAISGTIRLGGQPLAAGAVLLDPISERTGTAVGATIHDGGFAIARKDGPVPGSYKVRIYASSRIQAPAPKGASQRKPRPMVELIPEKYNSRTELSAEIVSGQSSPLIYDLAPSHE
jgi:hypothetical protein